MAEGTSPDRPWLILVCSAVALFSQLALRAREASSFAVLSKNSESHLILHTFPSAPLIRIFSAHTLVIVVNIVYSWTITQPSLFAWNVQEKNAKRTTEQVTARGQMSWSYGDHKLSKPPMLAVIIWPCLEARRSSISFRTSLCLLDNGLANFGLRTLPPLLDFEMSRQHDENLHLRCPARRSSPRIQLWTQKRTASVRGHQ